MPKLPGQEWSALLERLRLQPRAGEINNGPLNARLADIFTDSGEVRSQATALQAEYEKELLERGAKWDSELKDLRAQYEEKIVSRLPEPKREAAKKFLEASRAKWTEAAERDAKMRSEFMDRMRTAARLSAATRLSGTQPATGVQQANPSADASAWMKDARTKATQQDSENVLALRSLLEKDDVERFDRYNRFRAPTPVGVNVPQPGLPVRPPQPPSVAPVAPPANPQPAPLSPVPEKKAEK
jgi:hypothetical protein